MPVGSVERVVRARLALVEALEPRLRSLVHVDAAGALARAAELDALPEAARGPLHGLVAVVKDNIDVAGQPTACCSPAHDGRAAARDAPVVARLKEAGAVVFSRANMDELAMGASTATSCHGPTHNPWAYGHSPGGSSGGCAAAVAAGIADLAVGTDTGGSVREPASQCGVVGLAPSPGLLPVAGVVPFDPSCDRVGVIAGDLATTARALAVLAGRVPGLTTDPPGAPPRRPSRVGVVRELMGPPNRPGVVAAARAAVERCRTGGADVVEVSVPDAPRALDAYLVLTSLACLPHLEPWVDTGRSGAEVVRRVALGRALAEDPDRVAAAAAVRDRLRAQTAAALARCDVLLSPTMPTTAPAFPPEGPTDAAVADPALAPYTDCWTVVANLVGLPAVSVPAGLADGLPVGVMLTGAAGSDPVLLHAAALVEDPTPLPAEVGADR
ncbi:amidase [Phycicoccus sp. BSK3Z-2]|uniref:Amidase n=1 Tax=Phycicoccus avicenniae TaxID=2828860 RepID=A0A941I007_9MICO|nr:amidase [Phycicoccus avicenniae]MBR7743405.1 amidase [Phycicoccus avicenniae]